MPNLCDFSIMVKGKPKDLEIVKLIFKADYSYSSGKLDYCTEVSHLFRTWTDFEAIDEDVSEGYLSLCGYCAWSVSTCMLEGGGTYYERMKNYQNFKGTSLLRISKEYNVDIEVYSSECGMCFQEHYLIKNGELLIDECVEWFEEYKEELDDYVSTGGFGDWEFSI